MSEMIHPYRWLLRRRWYQFCYRFQHRNTREGHGAINLSSKFVFVGLFLIISIVVASFALDFARPIVKPNRPTSAIVLFPQQSWSSPYEVKYEQMAARLRIGMMEEDVEKALGEPAVTEGTYGFMSNHQDHSWVYEVDTNTQLKVRLNDNGKVASWTMLSRNAVHRGWVD